MTAVAVQALPVTSTPAPTDCCPDNAAVVHCADGIDTHQCWVCGSTWNEPCATPPFTRGRGRLRGETR